MCLRLLVMISFFFFLRKLTANYSRFSSGLSTASFVATGLNYAYIGLEVALIEAGLKNDILEVDFVQVLHF